VENHPIVVCPPELMCIPNDVSVYSHFPKAILLAACENDLSL
jgi:hypothetical protein